MEYLSNFLIFVFSVAVLYDTVHANVCSSTYESSPRNISATSTNSHDKCQYYIRASRNYYVVLNFTNIYGFWPTRREMAAKCLPSVTIKEISADGHEHEMAVICEKNHNSVSPQVFHSKTSLVQVTYTWVPGEPSGFYLEYHFEEECAFRCDDSFCLPYASLVCNGDYDCVDKSDEKHCNTLSTTHPSSNIKLGASATGDYIQTIVIVIAVIFTLCVIICVVCYYCVLSQPWRTSRHRLTDHLSSSSEHNQLRPHTPPQTRHAEMVYVPGTPSDRHRQRSGGSDPMELPPHIPFSPDGEEGYSTSQQLLQTSCDTSGEIERGSIRSPPNVTIFDSRSPYPASSPPLLERQKYPSHLIPDSPVSVKCFSSTNMSNNNYPNNVKSQCHRTPPGGRVNHSRHSSGGNSSERPPEYCDVIASLDSYRNQRGGNV